MTRTQGNRRNQSSRFATHALLFFLCLVLMLVGKADIPLVNSLRSLMTGVAVPVADVVSVPFKAVSSILENVTSVANLREENLLLKRDVEALKQWRRRAEILQSENRQLRSVSGVIIPESTTPVSARVIALNADSFAHSVMVNVGSNQGIKKGNAVTTTSGLVGIVVDTGSSHAQILLITDINAMIPIILSSSSWPGIAAGRNSKLMQLQFLPTEASVTENELVQTSGHGGILPPGIPVGRIERVNNNSVTIRPVADLQRLSFVTILVMDEAPTYAVDDIYNQRVSPLPEKDDEPFFEGINALGQRIESDIPNER